MRPYICQGHTRVVPSPCIIIIARWLRRHATKTVQRAVHRGDGKGLLGKSRLAERFRRSTQAMKSTRENGGSTFNMA